MVYIRTLLAAIEQLHAGTTCVIDFLYELPNPTDETIAAVVQAYRDAGIRAVIVISMWDRPVADVMPIDHGLLPEVDREAWDAKPPTRRQWIELAKAGLAAVRDDDRVGIGLAIDQPQRCTDDLMLAIGDLSAERDLPVHTHSLESRLCRYTGLWRFGASQVTHLGRLGLISPRMSFVHSVWVDDADIELMAAGGANVVHNPVSNLKLGSGIAPVRAFLTAGINVAIGTDGESTNDARDMFEATKLAALIQRPANPDYRSWPTATETWTMATRGGARAANLGDSIGSIEVGRRADLVLLDIDDPSLVPLLDPLNQVVFSSASRAVRDVIVNGRLVVVDGRVVTVDPAAVAQEATKLAGDLAPGRRSAREEGDRLRPMLDELFERAWGSDVGDIHPARPRSDTQAISRRRQGMR
jgi:cytosine/adenosine deaminase-related metal-dependent hydrolase